MPWRETCPMDERKKFIDAWLENDAQVAELCRQHGVSRRTGYKWIARYRQRGEEGLKDRSRAPNVHPNAVTPGVASLLIATKQTFPDWGPKKVVGWLALKNLGVELPAVSTAGEILKKAGLVKPRRIRRRATPFGEPFQDCCAPNDVWCADFKGHFALRGGRERCHPLTTTDAYSRFVFSCRALPTETYALARPIFEEVFQQYGLPGAIRTDNGEPFANVRCLAGLSRLSVWWTKLGIRHERIDLGRPDQNGRHERMHRTLKQANKPAETMRLQQLGFDKWIEHFNHVRPHEALGQHTPASVHTKSVRAYLKDPPDPEYPGAFATRRVGKAGNICWRQGNVFVGTIFKSELLGLEEFANGRFLVRFGQMTLGILNAKGQLSAFIDERVVGPTE